MEENLKEGIKVECLKLALAGREYQKTEIGKLIEEADKIYEWVKK